MCSDLTGKADGRPALLPRVAWFCDVAGCAVLVCHWLWWVGSGLQVRLVLRAFPML